MMLKSVKRYSDDIMLFSIRIDHHDFGSAILSHGDLAGRTNRNSLSTTA